MRVPLDKNLDWRLIRDFNPDFQVTTVARLGWKGKRNGELLQQAAAAFDALVTMDSSIEYQQNPSKYAVSVIVISARSNRLQDVQPAMSRVNQVLREVQPGQVVHVTADAAEADGGQG
ncbi:hypothetical protein F4X33_19890 [Candidatus Poribacteria bacterium]|nr:hypothetical protein [Candidatus Poribacteria bacterium]